MIITSLENEKIKRIVKLHSKKYRDQLGLYLVEGEHLVEESLKAGCVKEIILLEGVQNNFGCDYSYVSLDVLKKISSMDTPPKMMAVCYKKNDCEIIGDKVLLLDGLQDPGNLGTIIRSSLAFNVDTIVLSSECVDLYNPKVIRATQGMYNHINIISMDIFDAIKYMNDKDIPVYGTSVVNGIDASCLDRVQKSKYCLIMGNEGSGVNPKVLAICDKNLYIKMNSKVESLNVGVACSILLYEMER